uniref:Death domain-containing protein n=1 Tax=Schistocephalus solidus TaxID=70667 RepID=A0A183T2X7_SCHSO
LEVLLSRKIASKPRTGELERRAALEVNGYEQSSEHLNDSLHPTSSDEELVESIARSDLDMKAIAQTLGPDWPALAEELGLSRADCDSIAEENNTDIKRAYACLLLWKERSNKDAANSTFVVVDLSPRLGTVLGRALRRIGRDDILKQCMKNIELVQDEYELSVAVRNLQNEDYELEAHDNSAVISPDAASQPRPRSEEADDLTETAPIDVENVISPAVSSHEENPSNWVDHATEEERRAAVEQLVAELDDDIPTPPTVESGSDAGVEEVELVPQVKAAEPQKLEASQYIATESGVPLSMLQEDDATESSEVAVRPPLEATGNSPPVTSNDGRGTKTSSPNITTTPSDLAVYNMCAAAAAVDSQS